MNTLCFEQVEEKIITLRDTSVILDSDVADMYGVETKRVNEAVTHNPDKFPEGYIFHLTSKEWNQIKYSHLNSISNNDLQTLRSKISTAKLSKTRVLPKAFTERGLYMLATILRSEQATQTTLAIIDTFYKLRLLSRQLSALTQAPDSQIQKSLLQKSNTLISELLNDELPTITTETTLELNLAILKLKHCITKSKQTTDSQ